MLLDNKEFLNLLMIKQNKAIFLDRDGVLNKNRDDYVKTLNELDIFPEIGKCIKMINDRNYLAIVITNQSAIARKLTTQNEVEKIHKYIQNFLKKWNAKIDAFYYCPHHPDDNCVCRKPQPGLILQAAHDFNIDLKKSWMIGDHDRDIQSGVNAGCQTIKISSNDSLEKIIYKIFQC